MAEHVTPADARLSGDHDALCAALRDALAQQRALLPDQTRGEIIVGGSVGGGDAMLTPMPNTTLDPDINTAIEEEIARLEQALRDNGCD